MNVKKARQIRQAMKSEGIDPREATYMPVTRTHGFCDPIRLRPYCGRAGYKARKRAA